MGGSIPIPAEWVYALLALLLVPLPFVASLAIRVVVGRRERPFLEGLEVFGLSLLCLGVATWVGKSVDRLVFRKVGFHAWPLIWLLAALVVVAGFRSITATSWWRATLGVLLTGLVYGGLGFALLR